MQERHKSPKRAHQLDQMLSDQTSSKIDNVKKKSFFMQEYCWHMCNLACAIKGHGRTPRIIYDPSFNSLLNKRKKNLKQINTHTHKCDWKSRMSLWSNDKKPTAHRGEQERIREDLFDSIYFVLITEDKTIKMNPHFLNF